MFSATGFNTAVTSDAVDPVVEADTFLAFGRDAQAEEILLEAMKTDSQRLAIPLKLLDIYASRKNPSQFLGVARQLHELTGGTGPEWEKAAAMGAALDPENALYGVAAPAPVQPAEPAASAPDFGATMVMSAPPAQSAQPEESSEAVVLDFDLDLDAAEPAANAASGSFDASNAEVAALDIDFDMPAAAPVDTLALDVVALDISDISAPQVSAPAPEAALPLPLDANNIDFEFDLGESAAVPEPEPEPEPEPVAAMEVDFGFEMPAVSAPEPAMPVLDMDIDFDTPPAAPQMAEPLMTPGIDLAGISLDLDAPEPSISGEDERAVSPASTIAAEDANAIPDNPEVATKLELALAYEEMGDRDGARELFQEAINEGSPGQQAIARAKLDGLG